MVDLNFHCCMCGEENDQKVFLNLEDQWQRVTVDCQYCKEKLVMMVEAKHTVTEVDNE